MRLELEGGDDNLMVRHVQMLAELEARAIWEAGELADALFHELETCDRMRPRTCETCAVQEELAELKAIMERLNERKKG